MIAVVVILLYVITGFYGPRSHLAEITAQAEARYARADEREKEEAQIYAQEGIEPRESRLLPDGPKVGVEWAFPILPCVLLVDSYEVLGRLAGHGGPRIVFYFGVTTFYIETLFKWMS